MSQITTCPSCGTRFRVVADQLRISDGWVRCGQCQEVFDARLHLDGEKGESSVAPPTANQSQEQVRAGGAEAGRFSKPFAPYATPSVSDVRTSAVVTQAPLARGQLSHEQDAGRERAEAERSVTTASAPSVPLEGYELPGTALSSEIDFSAYQPDAATEAAADKSEASSIPEALGLDEADAPHTQPPVPSHRSADLQAAREAVLQAQDALATRAQETDAPRAEPLWDAALPAARKSEFPSLDLSVLQVSVPAAAAEAGASDASQKSSLDVAAKPVAEQEHVANKAIEEGQARSIDSGRVSGGGALSSSSQPIDPVVDARGDVPVHAPGHVSHIPPPRWPELDPVLAASPAEVAPRTLVDDPVLVAHAPDVVQQDATPKSPSTDAMTAPTPAVESADSVPTVDALESAAQRLAQTHGVPTEVLSDSLAGDAQEAEDAAEDEPGFVREARRKAWWQKPAVRVAMGAAVVVLPVALVLQIALHERNALVAWQPSLRPAMEFMCTALQCELAPRQHISSMVVSGSSFTQSGERSYVLSLSIQNKARTPLGVPALELTLTDAQDQAIARKVISAKELGAPSELAAGREWTGSVPVSTAGLNLQVAGFRLMLFYP